MGLTERSGDVFLLDILSHRRSAVTCSLVFTNLVK
jgi:hypothetical protein